MPVRRLGSLYLLAELAVAVGSVAIFLNATVAGPSARAVPVPIAVDFGAPVVGTVACGSNELATERIGWVGASENLTTGEVYMKLVELVDGDFIGTADPPGNVTPSSLCAGDPPQGALDWYLVLGAPDGGPYEAVYSYHTGWLPVGPSALPVPIRPGSTLTVVSVRSFANDGFGLAVEGGVGSPPVAGEVTL